MYEIFPKMVKNNSPKEDNKGMSDEKATDGSKDIQKEKLRSKDKDNATKLDSTSFISNRSQSVKLLKDDASETFSSFADGDAVPVEEVEEKKDDHVLKDILAEEERAKEMRTTGETSGQRPAYDRRNLMRRETFSLGNMDVYLHYKYRHVPAWIRCGAECGAVLALLLVWPLTLALLEVRSGRGVSAQTGVFLRSNLFLALSYAAYAIASLATERILAVAAGVLRVADVSIQGRLAEWLQIVSSSRHHLRNSVVALAMFGLGHWLLAPYVFLALSRAPLHVAMTGLFWLGALSAVLFVEKLCMNHLTSELRRRTFRARILAANFRSFVLVKLAAVAEAHTVGSRAIDDAIRSYVNDYDAGFFLRYAELDLTSEKRARAIGEGILFFLDADALTLEMLRRFFPDCAPEAYAFLRGAEVEPGALEHPPIGADSLVSRCIELYQERSDIARSLYYRDMVLRKLDRILVAVVLLLGGLAYMTLLRIDYRVYVTSIGPTFIGFGWIFQDSIKEIYRCFVFLLANHPYDCGDRVVIDGQELTVHSIDLLFSTFLTQTGRIRYIPNASMFLKPIENIRRSAFQSERVAISVPAATPYPIILRVRNELADFLKTKTNDFTGSVTILDMTPKGDLMAVQLLIEHSSNFQDQKPRFARRGLYTEELEKILERNDIPRIAAFEYSD